MYKLRPYQLDLKIRIYHAWKEHKSVMATLATGGGKCLAKGTKILMYDATIKNVEDIIVGDVLISPTNEPCKVLSTTTGYEKMYKIIPVKGEPFVCNESHILSLKATGRASEDADFYRYPSHRIKGQIVNISVKEYLTKSKYFKHLHKLWRCPVTFKKNDIELPFEPYIFGVWLGDGTSRRFEFTNGDIEIENYLYEYAEKNDYTVTKEYNSKNSSYFRLCEKIHPGRKGSKFFHFLKDYNLFRNKHIPNIYKRASEQERLELLAGIIDTDGYYSKKGFSLTMKGEQFANDIVFLARSLGFAAYSRIKEVKVDGKIFIYYSISISGDIDKVPCKVERRKANVRKQKKSVLVTGFTVEPLEVDKYYGFEIDGDRLFMLADFTVTHNTILFSSIAKDCVDRNGKVLILAHREELILQAANKLTALGLDVGIIKSGFQPTYWKPVQVASVQTLVRRDFPYKFALCIVDEAHHDQHDNSYGKIRKKLSEANPDMLTLGVTATPIRLNGSGFKDIYDVLVKGISIKELINQGYLVAPKYLSFPYVHLGKIKKTGGDYNLKELSEVYQSRIPAQFLAKDYLEHAKGLQTIVFAIDIAHSKEIEKTYKEFGIKIYHIDGTTDDTTRKRVIEDFANKNINVITNVGVFTEGYDCPGIEAVQLARPTESLSMYMQMSGRGLRPADNKEQCLIMDRANCIINHGLLESDRNWELGKNSGTKKSTKVVAQDIQTGLFYDDLRCVPSSINPKFISIIELDIKEFEKIQYKLKATMEFEKFKARQELKNYHKKWIWYQMIRGAKSIENVMVINDVFVAGFNYKPGFSKYLLEEYKGMLNVG